MSSKNFYFARNVPEIFQQFSSVKNLSILGGCTTFAVQKKPFPEENLCIRNIEELKTLEKKERFLEAGSEVTLSELESLGKNNLPSTVFEAVKTIANPFVKNLATLGGNICAPDFFYTMYAPLLALDARLEFQNGQETSTISMYKFEKVPHNSILTKVRIPFYDWSVAIFKRVGPKNLIDKNSASFVFLADSNKSQISQLRIAFAGIFRFRDADLENKLLGAHLPLSENTISEFLLEAESLFNKQAKKAGANPILEKQFWNLLKYSLEQLT